MAAAYVETGPKIRNWILATFPAFGEVAQDNVPASFERYIEQQCVASDVVPYVWFSRVGTERDPCLSEQGGRPDIESFAVEFVGPDIGVLQEQATCMHDQDSIRLIDDLNVQGLFVDDQGDDYVIRNAAEGLEVIAFDLEIIHWK